MKMNLAPQDWQEYHHLVKCSIDDVEMAKYQIQSWDIAIQHAQNCYQFGLEQRMSWAATFNKARRTLYSIETDGKKFAEAMPSNKTYIGPGMMSQEDFMEYLKDAKHSADQAADEVGAADIKNHMTNYQTLMRGGASDMFVNSDPDMAIDIDNACIKEPEIKRQRAASSSGS